MKKKFLAKNSDVIYRGTINNCRSLIRKHGGQRKCKTANKLLKEVQTHNSICNENIFQERGLSFSQMKEK